MVKKVNQKVTKEEFEKFLNNYPNKLDRDVNHIPEPPIMTFNDFTGGLIWPESVVAKIILNSAWDKNDPDDYYIQENN